MVDSASRGTCPLYSTYAQIANNTARVISLDGRHAHDLSMQVQLIVLINDYVIFVCGRTNCTRKHPPYYTSPAAITYDRWDQKKIEFLNCKIVNR